MKKKNFLYTAISIGSRLVAGLLLFVILARLWGPSDLGLYSFAFGISMMLVLIVDFGFPSYLLREIGADPSQLAPVFRAGLRAKTALIIPFVVIGALVVGYYGEAVPWEMALPMLLTALLLSFSEYFIAPLRALGRYDLETAVITVSNLVNFAVAGATAWLGGSPYEVAWISLLTRMQYFFTAAWVLNLVAPDITCHKAQLPSVKQTFRRVLPYGTDGLLSAGWNQLDVVVVGSIFGAHTLGIYAAGQKMVQGLYTLAQVVGNVMIPSLARLAHTHDRGLGRSANITMIGLSGIGLVFALPLWFFSDGLTHLLFGAKFAELCEVLPLFGLILLLRYVSAGSGVVLTSIGMQSYRVKYQAYGISVFLLGSLFLNQIHAPLPQFVLCYALGVFVMTALFQIGWIRFVRS